MSLFLVISAHKNQSRIECGSTRKQYIFGIGIAFDTLTSQEKDTLKLGSSLAKAVNEFNFWMCALL